MEADLAITGDAEATLPELIEAVKKLMTPDRRSALEERGTKIAEANRQAARSAIANSPPSAGTPAPSAPRACPPSSGRRSRTKTGRWYRTTAIVSSWPTRLWNFEQTLSIHRRARRRRHRLRRPRRRRRGSGQQEARPPDRQHPVRRRSQLRPRRPVDRRASQDPAAEHHAQQPRLSRGAHVHSAARRQVQSRHRERADIGTALNGPNIDYASIAKGYGLYAEGPITDPNDLGPALKRAIERVKAGEPALLDVVTQPR